MSIFTTGRRTALKAAAVAVAGLVAGPAGAGEDVNLAPDKAADTVPGQPGMIDGAPIADFDKAGEHAGLAELLVTDQTITGQPLEWGNKPFTFEMYRIVVPPGAKSSPAQA